MNIALDSTISAVDFNGTDIAAVEFNGIEVWRKAPPVPDTWEVKTWSYGTKPYDGRAVWSDGDSIYVTYTGNTNELDISENTWKSKTWNVSNIYNGNYIWTDGTDIYYSNYQNESSYGKITVQKYTFLKY